MNNIEIKLENLCSVRDKYKELVKVNPDCNYRLNAIEEQISVLVELLEGDTTVEQWKICYKEDLHDTKNNTFNNL